VRDRERLTIHAQYQERVRITRHGQRQPPLHLWEVTSLAHKVDGFIVNRGSIEYHMKGNTFPDRVPGSVVAPGSAVGNGSEAGASVAGTLEEGGQAALRHRLQVVKAQVQGTSDAA